MQNKLGCSSLKDIIRRALEFGGKASDLYSVIVPIGVVPLEVSLDNSQV
jgi:hypothetical protein